MTATALILAQVTSAFLGAFGSSPSGYIVPVQLGLDNWWICILYDDRKYVSDYFMGNRTDSTYEAAFGQFVQSRYGADWTGAACVTEPNESRAYNRWLAELDNYAGPIESTFWNP